MNTRLDIVKLSFLKIIFCHVSEIKIIKKNILKLMWENHYNIDVINKFNFYNYIKKALKNVRKSGPLISYRLHV